jgi:uncharacterized membrane protein
MFQTHVLDSYVADGARGGWFWALFNRQLGGMPSRLFLFLAGVALALRLAADRRRGVPGGVSRRRAARRGLEVLLLAYAFRVAEWLLSGADLARLSEIGRVDILNCIGLSLAMAALLPGDLAAALLLLLPALTPLLEQLRPPLPPTIAGYLFGPLPGAFPLCPWLAYLLLGQVCGALLVRGPEERLPRRVALGAAIGALLVIAGQAAFRAPLTLYPFASYTTPAAFLYRGGLCLLCGGLAYAWSRRADPARPSPLRLLGQTSLFAYVVHVELVYGHLSDPLKRRLSPGTALLAVALVSLLMLVLCWAWRRLRRTR